MLSIWPFGRIAQETQALGNGHRVAESAVSPELEYLEERLAELELSLAQEDAGWMSLIGDGEQEFSRDAIGKIASLARLNYLKNPLIRRAVDVQMYYVFGQDVTIRADDPEVNDVIQAFLDDTKNRVELTGHQARQLKEVDLRLFGNLFFVFFPDAETGRVRVRTIPLEQIDDIVCNPEDAKEPQFYLRAWTQTDVDGKTTRQKRAYVDWWYAAEDQPDTVRGYPVDWEHPVYHVKAGGLSNMRFGVSEVYPALDWAKAYKAFLEDWATLTRAYSRFAHKLTLPSTKGIAAAKARLGSTLGEGSGETNPPPVTGSTFIAGPGTDISPIRIGGANVSMEDGRRLLLMVAAAVGLPETFFGDTAIGSLATARSLDRPTELQMRNRQAFWGDVYLDILNYVVLQSVKAGALAGRIIEEPDGTPRVELPPDPETGEPREAGITVEWPPILEHDIPARVAAITDAATLKGLPVAPTMDPKTVSRLLLQTLGAGDVDALLDELYPPEEEQMGEPPAVEEEPPTVTEFAAALRDLRTVVSGMIDGQ